MEDNTQSLCDGQSTALVGTSQEMTDTPPASWHPASEGGADHVAADDDGVSGQRFLTETLGPCRQCRADGRGWVTATRTPVEWQKPQGDFGVFWRTLVLGWRPHERALEVCIVEMWCCMRAMWEDESAARE
mmetsp:Transcript_26187/g.53365  ORF Transcript_26187/g.53365 Transcript_26187/m.53365 type:complete len:131 (-) Transcript_26187:260-652(-)